MPLCLIHAGECYTGECLHLPFMNLSTMQGLQTCCAHKRVMPGAESSPHGSLIVVHNNNCNSTASFTPPTCSSRTNSFLDASSRHKVIKVVLTAACLEHDEVLIQHRYKVTATTSRQGTYSRQIYPIATFQKRNVARQYMP